MSQSATASGSTAATVESIKADHSIARPLDLIISEQMRRLDHKGRGFVFSAVQDAGEGKPVSVAVQETLPPEDLYEPPTNWRKHELHDTDSLIAFAKKYGTAEDSLIVVDDDVVTLSLDELKERGDRELITLPFPRSDDFDAWNDLLERSNVNHKTLLDTVIRHAHNLTDLKVLDALRTVRGSATVKFDSDLRESAESVGAMFTTTKGDELLQFPKAFAIKVPILDTDDDAEDLWHTVSIRLHVVMPTQPGEGIRFLLVCPGWKSAQRARIGIELDKLRENLPDWTIVRGTHQQAARTVGRNRNQQR